MGKLTQPSKAIRDYHELKVGDIIYYFGGSHYPFYVGKEALRIVRAPELFKQHPKYSSIHMDQADEVVFTTVYHNNTRIYENMEFASDNNLRPGYSHNDNYLFRSLEDAEEFARTAKAECDSNPKLMQYYIDKVNEEKYERYEDY